MRRYSISLYYSSVWVEWTETTVHLFVHLTNLSFIIIKVIYILADVELEKSFLCLCQLIPKITKNYLKEGFMEKTGPLVRIKYY